MTVDALAVPRSRVDVGFFEDFAQCIRLTRYRESFYSLIASYMDESLDNAGTGLFVVGGLMARGPALFELDRKWEKLCKRSDIAIAYFRAIECKNGRGEFAKFVAEPGKPTASEHERLDAISQEFLSLIPQEQNVVVHGVGVVQSDFYDVIKDANARAILGDSPYRLAYDLAMIQCAWLMKQLETSIQQDKEKRHAFGPSDRVHVSFVCDEHEQYSPLAEEAYRNLKRTNPNAAQYMATFTSGDDKVLPVLQAADSVAFEMRRALNVALGMGYKVLRKQFSILADPRKVALITHTTKENLMQIVAGHKPGDPFNFDDIMQAELPDSIKFF